MMISAMIIAMSIDAENKLVLTDSVKHFIGVVFYIFATMDLIEFIHKLTKGK